MQALVGKQPALHDAEAMLLIDYCKREFRKSHLILNQCMGPNDQLNFPR